MVLAIFLVFCTVGLIGYSVLPVAYNKTTAINQRRSQTMATKLDRVMPRRQIKKIIQIYTFAPLMLAGTLYLLFPAELKYIGIALGIVGGIIFPAFYTKILIGRNKRKFSDQLVDALMIMSSSFRGGLSLVQAMEAVVEEMDDPIAQEFATVLGENKMGVTLDEALNHLYNRMPSTAVQQMTTAILLARETGGNLPAIFSRIVGVIREQKRIQQQIDTLTIQGKIQGVVMSLLPLAFFGVIFSSNPDFFAHMLVSELGRMLLILAAVLEVVGAFMIWKISVLKDY